jgi:hypothetical protein
MKKDTENPTCDHTLDTLCSESGYRFQREKCGPKLAFMKDYFEERFPEIALLDVGVGYGVFLKIAAEDFGLRNPRGVDPYPNSIEIAKSMVPARIERGSLFDEKWPFEERAFDAITCFDVLEHLEKPDSFFVNVQPPSYWKNAAARNGYEVVASWNGEYLTHIRLVPKILKALCAALRIDPRTVPLVNAFE